MEVVCSNLLKNIGTDKQNTGFIEIIKEIYEKEQISGFYKGFGPNLVLHFGTMYLNMIAFGLNTVFIGNELS